MSKIEEITEIKLKDIDKNDEILIAAINSYKNEYKGQIYRDPRYTDKFIEISTNFYNYFNENKSISIKKFSSLNIHIIKITYICTYIYEIHVMNGGEEFLRQNPDHYIKIIRLNNYDNIRKSIKFLYSLFMKFGFYYSMEYLNNYVDKINKIINQLCDFNFIESDKNKNKFKIIIKEIDNFIKFIN
jgi:hypothetical protein